MPFILLYNKHVYANFLIFGQEYIQDGIDWTKVDFEDNQACLNLFEKVMFASLCSWVWNTKLLQWPVVEDPICHCLIHQLYVFHILLVWWCLIEKTFFFLQKPLGLLSLLDEESTFPNGTDLTFANKLKQHLKSNSCFIGEREKAFTVSHYAGEVMNTYLLLTHNEGQCSRLANDECMLVCCWWWLLKGGAFVNWWIPFIRN